MISTAVSCFVIRARRFFDSAIVRAQSGGEQVTGATQRTRRDTVWLSQMTICRVPNGLVPVPNGHSDVPDGVVEVRRRAFDSARGLDPQWQQPRPRIPRGQWHTPEILSGTHSVWHEFC